jgi:hypothetical protein
MCSFDRVGRVESICASKMMMRLWPAVVLALCLIACSSSTGTPTAPSPAASTLLSVAVSPYIETLQIGAVQQFSVNVQGPVGTPPVSQSVVWSVSGPGCSGANCGTIDASGKYTAPASVPDPATVMVTATTADSRQNGSLTIVIVAVAGESVSFSLSPGYPASVVFDNQTVNTTSAAKAVTLTNTGGMPQPVFGRIGGSPGQWQDFAFTTDCPSTIAVGASCTFNITFTPSAAASVGASLVVDGFFEQEAFVNLSGLGTPK